MPLTVNSKLENQIAILDLEGSLTLGPSLQSVREAVKRHLGESGLRGIVLNVSRVPMADSAGLGELTVVYTLAARAGARVALMGVRPNLLTMLEVTHLDALLPSAASLEEAAALFS